MAHNQQKPISLDRSFLRMLAVIIVLTLVSGTLYGRLTLRWGPPADLVSAAEHVSSFPKQLGDWQLLEDSTMSDSIQEMLGCAGYINRRYTHKITGQSVGLALIVGPAGPTAVHTPEICFSSRSYKVKGTPQPKLIEKQGDSFWGIHFDSRHVGAEQLQVYYAWSKGLRWEASANPRIQFGGESMLYKVQISGNVGLGFSKELADPAWDFANAFSSSSWSPMTTGFNSK